MNDYDEILVSLRKITRAIDLHSRRVLKTSGLTTSQLLVLQSIDRLGNSSPSAIAREVVLSQATVSSLLDRLSNHGLILRCLLYTSPSPRDISGSRMPSSA